MIDYSDYMSAFFIWYVPMAIFTFFVFDILGVKKIFSLIPIYNVYKLLDEYQGRVIYITNFTIYSTNYNYIFTVYVLSNNFNIIVTANYIYFWINFGDYISTVVKK